MYKTAAPTKNNSINAHPLDSCCCPFLALQIKMIIDKLNKAKKHETIKNPCRKILRSSRQKLSFGLPQHDLPHTLARPCTVHEH